MKLSVSGCFLAQSNSKSSLRGYNSERIHDHFYSQSDTLKYSLAYLLRPNLLYLFICLFTYLQSCSGRSTVMPSTAVFFSPRRKVVETAQHYCDRPFCLDAATAGSPPPA